MPRKVGARALKVLDTVVAKTAGVAFDTIQLFNQFSPNPSFTPQWSDKPLLKSWEKSKPTLGWPRQTDSLCPDCVKEARNAIFDGTKDWRDLLTEKVGTIYEEIVLKKLAEAVVQIGPLETLKAATAGDGNGHGEGTAEAAKREPAEVAGD